MPEFALVHAQEAVQSPSWKEEATEGESRSRRVLGWHRERWVHGCLENVLNEFALVLHPGRTLPPTCCRRGVRCLSMACNLPVYYLPASAHNSCPSAACVHCGMLYFIIAHSLFQVFNLSLNGAMSPSLPSLYALYIESPNFSKLFCSSSPFIFRICSEIILIHHYRQNHNVVFRTESKRFYFEFFRLCYNIVTSTLILLLQFGAPDLLSLFLHCMFFFCMCFCCSLYVEVEDVRKS